jgi:pyruvate-ferredoxin/flavodoxin oxidoreductase
VQDRALEARYPGIPTTGDGADMVVWAETQISQGAVAFPITSSTTMGQGFEAAYAAGAPNLWGDELVFIEPESEHSSASAAEGFALSGGRVTNFTSGQGLVLMKEVLYTISGKRLPVVFHIGARALTSQSLNVHAGHDDVMAVADCGWGMLFARDGQEAGDLALISRRAAEDSATPFFNVQDGFLTTHTIQNYLQTEPEFMKEFVGSPAEKLHNLMDPSDPVMSGVVQNQDSYMKGKIAQRAYTDRVSEALERAFDEFAAGTGRRYDFVRSYRLEDAEYAIVAMGSMIETAEATIDWLRDERGLRVGALQVTSFRPFPGRQIVEALRHVRAFAVVERMDNPLAESNPLTLEVKAAFADAIGDGRIDRLPRIDSGVAGLGSRDVRASDFVAVAENLAATEPRPFFVLGVDHPLTLPAAEEIDVRPTGSFSMRGHSVGGFGSITTNKIIATVMADLFDLRVQAFPKYGSEKKGLPTKIRSPVSRATGCSSCSRRGRTRRKSGPTSPGGRSSGSAISASRCWRSTAWASHARSRATPIWCSACRASCCSASSCGRRRSSTAAGRARISSSSALRPPSASTSAGVGSRWCRTTCARSAAASMR